MLYLLYEIKNNINGKIYVGVHKTKVEDDGYMGSGKVIKAAIKKYGLENFTKKILERFDTAEAMFAREKEVVNEEFLAREDTYNLRRGGYGGFDFLNTEVEKNKRKPLFQTDKFMKQCSNGGKKISSMLTEEEKRRRQVKMGETLKIRYKNGYTNPFLGCIHSIETKQKIGQANSVHQQGPNNSQFGSMWITNGTDNKKIKKESPIPDGWRKGRI